MADYDILHRLIIDHYNAVTTGSAKYHVISDSAASSIDSLIKLS
jgi:hypothetical protein